MGNQTDIHGRKEQVFEEIEHKFQEDILPQVKKFNSWAKSARWRFRSLGTTIIALSILMPLCSNIDKLTSLVPYMATAVALLAAISTFFSLDETWKANSFTARSLENAVAVWRAQHMRAKHHSDPDVGIERAHDAFEALINTANTIRSQNSESFFENVKAPSVPS